MCFLSLSLSPLGFDSKLEMFLSHNLHFINCSFMIEIINCTFCTIVSLDPFFFTVSSAISLCSSVTPETRS